jgi:hypothetical protein
MIPNIVNADPTKPPILFKDSALILLNQVVISDLLILKLADAQ